MPSCLAAVQKAERMLGRTVEKIVVINRCTDRTEEIAQAAGCLIVKEDAKNLAKIRNRGVAQASGEIIVTIDADSQMSENFLTEISSKIQSNLVIGGGVLMLPSRWSLGITLTALCLVPIVLWHGISGGAFFVRKVDFLAIGGFNEEMVSVEDIDFAKRLKSYGKRKGQKFLSLYKAHIVTSTRKFDRFGDWFFLRNPRFFLSLFSGKNREAADKVWYEFER